MSRAWRATLWTVPVGAMLIALLLRVAATVDLSGGGLIGVMRARAQRDDPQTAVKYELQAALPPPKLETLVCFGCHDINRYRFGPEFSHELMDESVGHCHACHEFAGHI